jgi:S1-C subfamily serine protease
MKKLITTVFIITYLIAPQVSLAIDFTPNDLASVVQIKSIMPKAAIDQQIRSLAGFYSMDELANYRKQLEQQDQLGSGLMVTYSGCALTNKHVVYNQEVGASHENIHLWSTADLTKEPTNLGKAVVAWTMTLVDIALVCLENPQGQYYPHFRLNPADYQDFKLTLGESIYNLGYPLGGQKETLTLTSGLAAGVWDKDFLKGDLTITGGASGSPIFNNKKQVIGLASGNAGENGLYGIFLKPSYTYGWRRLYNATYRELISSSAGCLDADR